MILHARRRCCFTDVGTGNLQLVDYVTIRFIDELPVIGLHSDVPPVYCGDSGAYEGCPPDSRFIVVLLNLKLRGVDFYGSCNTTEDRKANSR